jgi:hypothetical protein
MKGVIVQVKEPKSIVLLNNGKVTAIPTPAGCHVGMVVTVKYSGLLKITIISIAAALLIALGIFIGANFFGGPKDSPDIPPDTTPMHMPMHRRMMEERR